MVCKDTTLQYFDVCKPVTVQVDVSKKGLGPTLLQDGHPVTFASKALTHVEQDYANIEHELLICVLSTEQFHTYIYGCIFTVESDHKPLGQIKIMNLADLPIHFRECCSNYRIMMSPLRINLAKRCRLQIPSITMHPSTLQRYCKRHHHQPCAHHSGQEI